MPMKSNSLMIFILMSCGLVVGLFIFGIDDWMARVFDKPPFPPETVVGSVGATQGDVRRRKPQKLTWIRIKTGDLIGEQDTIFTGENSKVKLDFKSSMTMKIGADSLITVSRIGGRNAVHIKQGQIEATSRSSENLIITGGGKKIEMALSPTPRRLDKKSLQSETRDEPSSEIPSGSHDDSFTPAPPEVWRRDVDFSDIRILIFLGLYVVVMVWAGIDSFRRREV
jgi:hypothetical protein